MNKIILVKDGIIKDDNLDIKINNNTLIIDKTMELYLVFDNYNKENLNIEILENVSLKLFILIKNRTKIIDFTYNIKKNGHLEVNEFHYNTIGGNINFNLFENAFLEFNFSNVSKNAENNKMEIQHLGKMSKSIIKNNCLCLLDSISNYEINSILPKNITMCNLDQTTKVILMDNASSSVNPNLYIDNEEVEARHGNSIGRFRDEDVFYLMSRGLSYNDSIRLLIKAFVLAILNMNLEFREEILKIINEIGGEEDV